MICDQSREINYNKPTEILFVNTWKFQHFEKQEEEEEEEEEEEGEEEKECCTVRLHLIYRSATTMCLSTIWKKNIR